MTLVYKTKGKEKDKNWKATIDKGYQKCYEMINTAREAFGNGVIATADAKLEPAKKCAEDLLKVPFFLIFSPSISFLFFD